MDVEKHDIRNVFKALDDDGSGDVDYVEFVDQLQRFKKQATQMVLFCVCDLKHKLIKLENAMDVKLRSIGAVELDDSDDDDDWKCQKSGLSVDDTDDNVSSSVPQTF